MKMITLFSLLALSLSAMADIPRPPMPSETKVEELQITGNEGLELYESLDVQAQPGSALRTGYSSFKIFRSDSGLTQIVCEKSVSRIPNGESKRSGTCKIQKSLTKKPLPVFKPLIRMG